MYRAARGNVSHSYSENWKSCSASLSFVSKELSIRIFFEAMTGPRAAEKRVLADADVAVGP